MGEEQRGGWGWPRLAAFTKKPVSSQPAHCVLLCAWTYLTPRMEELEVVHAALQESSRAPSSHAKRAAARGPLPPSRFFHPKAESGIPSSLGSEARPGRCSPAPGPPLAAFAVQVNRDSPILTLLLLHLLLLLLLPLPLVSPVSSNPPCSQRRERECEKKMYLLSSFHLQNITHPKLKRK